MAIVVVDVASMRPRPGPFGACTCSSSSTPWLLLSNRRPGAPLSLFSHEKFSSRCSKASSSSGRVLRASSASPVRRKPQLNDLTSHSSSSSSRFETLYKSLTARHKSCGPCSQAYRSPEGGFRSVRARIQSGDTPGAGDPEQGDNDTAEEAASESVVEEGAASRGEVNQSHETPLWRMRAAFSNAVTRFLREFLHELKNETGFDSEVARSRLVESYGSAKEKSAEAFSVVKKELQAQTKEVRRQITSTATDVRQRYWPQFVSWNRRELWQDKTQWNAQRVGAFFCYVLLFGAFLRGAQMVVTIPKTRKTAETLADSFLESVVPEPTPANVRKIKKAMWRDKMPEGLNVIKYKLGEDGSYERDFQFPGDHPEEGKGDDDVDADADKLIDESLLPEEEKEQLRKDIIESNSIANLEPIDATERVRVRVDINDFIDEMDIMTQEEKEILKKGIAEEKARRARENPQASAVQVSEVGHPGAAPASNWEGRLSEWDKVLKEENQREILDSGSSFYVADPLGGQDQLASETGDNVLEEGESAGSSMRAFWVARKWWKHRPTLPYTYLLDKIKDQEVRAAVYTEDMRKLYVTMKEGFPTEYVVDLPVDPTLHELLETCGVEIDILPRSAAFYYARIFFVFAPSLLIIWYIRQLQYQARARASEKVYDLLSMNRQHLILPEDAADKAKTQYKDVVVGGDVWQVIDEIMIYMRNPMKYHDRRVKLPRGILISGPPGTGKTLLARAIARESGLPFVFASGAEFVESGQGTGTDKVFDIFFTARANAPSFIFIDEIDALAGKNAKDDAERRATFEQLLSELDAEPEDTDVDRFARRQAVILICATNRPDELDEEFMRPGRIDREIHVGLPGEEERLAIFGVHSQGKPIAKGVDFSKLVFRTIGYSGADIRNLINEAGIMAVRKGHDEITQQDLIEVLDKQLFEGMGVVLMDDEQKRAEEKIPEENKKLLAIHEAGHVLLAHLFPNFDWHAFSHLLPGGSESALSVFYPREDMLQLGHTTIGYVMMQMVVAHGGRCAERLVHGDDNITDGGQDDLARISGMARELTISPTNRRLGLLPMKWRETLDMPKLPGDVDLIPNEWEKQGTQIVNMSVEVSEVFTREVTKFVDETEEIAMTALKQNRHILDKLASVLLARTKISGFEAEDVIKSMDPVLLPDFVDSGPKVDLNSAKERVAPPRAKGRYEEFNIYPAPLHQS